MNKEKPLLFESKIQNLIALLEKVSSFSDFVTNKSLMQEFYLSAAQSFGLVGIGFDEFENMCSHVHDVLGKLPELDKNFWNFPMDRLGRVFEISILKSYSLNIDIEKWQAHLDNWMKELLVAADLGDIDVKHEARISEVLSKRIHQIGNIDPDRNYSEFRAFLEGPLCTKIAAGLLYRHLLSRRNRGILETPQADVILSYLEEIRSNLNLVTWSDFSESSKYIHSTLRKMIPRTSELIKNSSLFSKSLYTNSKNKKFYANQLAGGSYNFIQIPSGLLSLTAALSAKDCSIYKNKKNPARWLLYLSNHSRMLAVTQQDRYHGFVMNVDLELNGKPAVAIESFSHLMKFVVSNSSNENATPRLFFDLVIERILNDDKNFADTALLSITSELDNFATMQSMRNSPIVKLSPPLAPEDQIKIKDHSIEAAIENLKLSVDPIFGAGPILGYKDKNSENFVISSFEQI